MMIYKNETPVILSCDPRACLATGAMGKPQTLKRVPIVKHENQPPPSLPPHSYPPFPFLHNTPLLRFYDFLPLNAGELAREHKTMS